MFSQQLEEQKQITAEIHQTNNLLQRQVQKLQQQPLPSLQKVYHQECCHSPTREMILREWRVGKRAPFKVIRGSGAAVVNGNVVYFMSSFGCQVFSFNFCTQKWNKLLKCPCWCSSLAVIRGLLTAIGGSKPGGTVMNKLVSIVTDADKKWVGYFPPMPTKRHSTAAVTTNQHLIEAGGERRSVLTNTVEAMDIQTLV